MSQEGKPRNEINVRRDRSVGENQEKVSFLQEVDKELATLPLNMF